MEITTEQSDIGYRAESLPKKRVVIVGGGISGLSTAWYLEQKARQEGLEVAYTVLEASDRWGGKILTERAGNAEGQEFVIEAGPDSFLTQKPWGLHLADDLGLTGRLLGTSDKARDVYVLQKGKPIKLPQGVLLIVPTKFMPFALSPLISPFGKMRMGLDLFIPPKRDITDETLADFVRRRLGNEALDKIAEPLMSGIYNAEADKQSIMATFPRFRQLEHEHGSLIRGILASRSQNGTEGAEKRAEGKLSVFVSFQGGTQELIDALVTTLNGDLCLQASVSSIGIDGSGSYQVRIGNGQSLCADAVILTAPAYITAGLVKPFAALAAERLASIRYVSTGTISLVFKKEDLRRPLYGFGLVVPKSECRPINAITVTSTKFSQRAPEGFVLLRVFFGGSRSPETMQLDDEQLLQVVRQELYSILGIDAPPSLHRIYRWEHANPQYDIGHLDLVEAIEQALPPGLHVTGSAFRGVGIPDCVYQAQLTASQVIDRLKLAEQHS